MRPSRDISPSGFSSSLIDRLRQQPLRIWLMLGVVVLAVAGFFEIVDDVFQDPLEGDLEAQHFDQDIAAFVRRFRSPALTQAMTDLTALGSVSVITLLFLVLASVLISYRDVKALLYLGVVSAGGGLWPLLLKPYFARARPAEVDRLVGVSDLSFPSGHSFGAATVYIALAYLAGRYARHWRQEVFFYVLGALLIVVVGASRIYLGVHYPTDVLAGLCGGIAWGLLISALSEVARRHRR